MRLLACLLLLVPTITAAQNSVSCNTRPAIVDELTRKWGESFLLRGTQKVATGVIVLEFWGSVERGTFTILQTLPAGISCVVATGGEFRNHGARSGGHSARTLSPADAPRSLLTSNQRK